jgi:hypothetical protein
MLMRRWMSTPRLSSTVMGGKKMAMINNSRSAAREEGVSKWSFFEKSARARKGEDVTGVVEDLVGIAKVLRAQLFVFRHGGSPLFFAMLSSSLFASTALLSLAHNGTEPRSLPLTARADYWATHGLGSVCH